MKAITLIAMLTIGCAAAPSSAVELTLTSPMPEQLPYVYPDLTLRLENSSPNKLLLPPSGLLVQVFLDQGAGWTGCHATVVAARSTSNTAKWEELAAGNAKVVPVPAFQCLCYDRPSTEQCHEWTDVPGTYRLKAMVSSDLGTLAGSDVPAGAFLGPVDSQPVEIVVKQPTGLDAAAIEWAKGSPMSVGVLKMFPGSEYAALFWYGRVRPDAADPVRTRSLIDRDLYPGPNSVPDPTSPNGWSSLDSEGVAKWQIFWGERVLREHPSFVYRDYAKIVVALSQISLGMKVEAQKTLDSLAANDRTAAGRWSRAFQAAGAPEKRK